MDSRIVHWIYGWVYGWSGSPIDSWSPKVEVGEPDWVHGCATGLGGMSVRLVHVWSVSRNKVWRASIRIASSHHHARGKLITARVKQPDPTGLATAESSLSGFSCKNWLRAAEQTAVLAPPPCLHCRRVRGSGDGLTYRATSEGRGTTCTIINSR